MHFEPFIIGIASFFIIGLFHPIVIKTEYYFSHKVWPVFLVFGLLCIVVTLVFYWNIIVNTVIALMGFSSFWSIKELFEQKERVEKGWFPKNPRRKVPCSTDDKT